MGVLIVEDDEAIRETMRLALESQGFAVQTAANGAEGLGVLKNGPPPCLILLDLMMPVMNGWEFERELRTHRAFSAIPVVAVTAYADRINGLEAKEVIKKPFDLRSLLAVVRRYCVH